MNEVELGRSGLRVFPVGLGMWQAGGPAWGDDVKDELCVAAMVRARELGVNLIDTAEVYGGGHSEEVVGRALETMGREGVVVATKVAGSHLRYDHVIRACEGSLRRLGVDRIDLYQIHWPDPWDQVPLRETMKALETLLREGKIRAIGVSNFAVRDLEEARSHLSTVDVAANQVQYSLLHREPEAEILPYCARERIAVLAWSPLAKGLLTGKYGPGRPVPTDRVREGDSRFRDDNLAEVAKLLRVLEGIGEARGKSIPQVALNWLLGHPGVVPIPGAKRPEQAEENAGAAGWSLSAAEREEIDRTQRSLRIDTF
jgi:aryl-alcohol dehydrogenase-like predicted oxidoreductase